MSDVTDNKIAEDMICLEDYSNLQTGHGYASRLQMFAVIIYILSQGFTIPILPVGPSWAVWPRLDDFATFFLVLVYMATRHNTCPMNSTERFFMRLVIIGAFLALFSTFTGKLMRPDIPRGPRFGIFQTFRVLEYLAVWGCIRGMAFSSRQFAKVSYTVFWVVIFVVLVCLGNITGKIPPARLISHLPQGAAAGAWAYIHSRTGVSPPLGPFGYLPGYLVDQLILLTAILLASKKPSALFRLPLVALVAIVVVLSGARAATIAWFLSLAIFSAKSFRQLIIMILVICMLLTGFYVFSGRIIEEDIGYRAVQRITSIFVREQDVTLSGRTEQWKAAIEEITSGVQSIFLGVGWGFGGFVLPGRIGNAHNMYLQVTLELGIFGLVGYIILLVSGYKLLRGKDRLLSAIRSGFLALLVAGMSGEVIYVTPSNGSFMGFAAAVFAIGAARYRGRLMEEAECYEEDEYSIEEYGYV